MTKNDFPNQKEFDSNTIEVTIEGRQVIKAQRTINIPREEYERYTQLRDEQGEPGGGRRFYEYCNELGDEWLSDPMFIYDWEEWDDVEIEEINDA